MGLLLGGPAAYAYQLYNRWGTTATDGSAGILGTPITLTWGIIADGTLISGNEGSSGSNLISFLDTNFGAGPGGSDLTQRPWFWIFADSYGRLSALSGVTYVYEPSNTSHSIDSSPFPQGQLGVRPDIRIGGHSVDGASGANSLAYSYFPDHSDLVIDTDNRAYFTNATNDYRSFRNILMHESGHGLGVNHLESSNARFLMEPILNTSYDGPQLDDILALQRNYGDALEKNGGNDAFVKATTLGSLLHDTTLSVGTLGDTTSVLPAHVDFVSIDGVSDTDFFSFSLTRPLDVTLGLTPRGATYNEGPEGGTQTSKNTKTFSDLTLALFDTDGTTLLDTANDAAAGFAESISSVLNPGTYYARVTGANNDIQLYGLNISAVRLAADLVWTGQQSSDWDVQSSENFIDSVGPVAFYDQDHVTFDDTATSTTINIAENVQPASVIVNTAGSYSFTGVGGITGGTLTLTGSGSVKLTNDGNSYEGPTDVQGGTLVIVSSTGIGDTIVHGGAVAGGGGITGGNLVALAEATIRPGGSLMPTTTGSEQDSTLTVDGDFTQLLGATLDIELRTVADFDALIVAGTTSLAGTLSVQLGDEFTATAGDRFNILSSIGGVTGTFSDLLVPDLGEFLTFATIYEANTVALSVVPRFISLPGDFDGDGDVDGRDFLIWQRGGSPTPFSAADLAEWQAHYGNNELFVAASVAVPEPAAISCLVLGIVGLCGRRWY